MHVDDIAWLIAAGGTWDSVTARCGVTRDAIDVACRRAGRLDLIDRLTLATGARPPAARVAS